MAIVRDLLDDALRELGVLAAGEVATADDHQLAFDRLNDLLDQWAAERLLIYTITRTAFTITANVGTYTVGTGGDISVARPVFLDHVNYIDTSTSPVTEYKLQPMTDDGWSGVSLKDQTSPMPGFWYYNPTYPLGTLYLWPIPTQQNRQGVLYAPAAVSQFTAVTDAVSLPPGYKRMIVKNLALELSNPFEKKPSQELQVAAIDAKAVVKRSNIRPMDMSLDLAVLGAGGHRVWYDIYKDQ